MRFWNTMQRKEYWTISVEESRGEAVIFQKKSDSDLEEVLCAEYEPHTVLATAMGWDRGLSLEHDGGIIWTLFIAL